MPDNAEGPTGDTIQFEYIKSNFFRVVHVDGVFGGVGPNLNINMAIWNQRHAIPQQITHAIDPSGKLGKEVREARIGKESLVREVEVNLVLDKTARVRPNGRTIDDAFARESLTRQFVRRRGVHPPTFRAEPSDSSDVSGETTRSRDSWRCPAEPLALDAVERATMRQLLERQPTANSCLVEAIRRRRAM